MPYKKSRACFGLVLTISILLLAVQACGLPFFAASPTPAGLDPNQVALLVTLALKDTELQATNAKLTSDAIPPSHTPVPPTQTPTSTLTETPTPTATWVPVLTLPPTATPVGGASAVPTMVATRVPDPGDEMLPKIYAEIDSNCRSGPAQNYKRLGYLLVGESSVIVGRNNSWTWWYIKEPHRTGILCWVWSGSTRVEGDTSNVPVIVMPTVTPFNKTPISSIVSFSIAGVKIVQCSGQQTIMIKVKNNGKNRFESAWLRIYDLSLNVMVYGPSSGDTPFRSSYQDCSAGIDNLDPDAIRYLGADIGNQNLSSHIIEISILMCTEEGLAGQCDSAKTIYKVP